MENSKEPNNIPPELTLELCEKVLEYFNSKLKGDIDPTPSLNDLALLASDIKKQIKKV